MPEGRSRSGDTSRVYGMEPPHQSGVELMAPSAAHCDRNQHTGGDLNFVTNDVDTVAGEKYIRLKIQQF